MILLEKKIGNSDKIGKLYLKKAVKELNKRNFFEAYMYVIHAYDIIVCDCQMGDWAEEINRTNTLMNIDIINCRPYEFDFLKAFIFLNCEQFDKAKNAINSFIDFNPNNEIGYYMKGKIERDIEDKINAYKKALSIKVTARTLYRLGRLQNDFNSLLLASVNGFYSSHCLGQLIRLATLEKRKLHINRNNMLVQKFNTLVDNFDSFTAEMDFVYFIDKYEEKTSSS